MTIYFLSGLGADSRAFKNLQFPPDIKTVFIDWLRPYSNESLTDYAKRISEKIDSSADFMLVGLSFGGVLATEVREYVKPQQTILISSVGGTNELSFFMRLTGLLRLNKLMPASATTKTNSFLYWLFGISENEDKLLLDEIMGSSDPVFSKWAIGAMVKWQRKESPKDIIRIHGTKDRIFPITNFTPDYTIEDGGHFMVVNKAEEISEIFGKILQSQK